MAVGAHCTYGAPIGLRGTGMPEKGTIAVIDDEGHLLGVVPRARLLATLSGEEVALDA